MNVEWLVTGIFLFGGMTAGAVSLYLKRRKEPQSLHEYPNTNPEDEKSSKQEN